MIIFLIPFSSSNVWCSAEDGFSDADSEIVARRPKIRDIMDLLWSGASCFQTVFFLYTFLSSYINVWLYEYVNENIDILWILMSAWLCHVDFLCFIYLFFIYICFHRLIDIWIWSYIITIFHFLLNIHAVVGSFFICLYTCSSHVCFIHVYFAYAKYRDLFHASRFHI